MLYIHVYGFLKKKFDPKAKLTDQTVVQLNFKENETFLDFLKRVNIDLTELGDCFINNKVIINPLQIIPDESRIGIFGSGMLLHEGGQYLKYVSIYEAKM